MMNSARSPAPQHTAANVKERQRARYNRTLTVAAPPRNGAATVRERWILTLLALDLTFDGAASRRFAQGAAL
jgi:hypothetical protein